MAPSRSGDVEQFVLVVVDAVRPAVAAKFMQQVLAEGKNHGTINSDLGLPDDKPTKELFEFLDGVLKKK